MVEFLVDTETQAHDLLFARAERRQCLSGLLFERARHGGVDGRQDMPILDQVTE
jgi:hypothetical protein